MSLVAGARLGPYEVLAPLGAGGNHSHIASIYGFETVGTVRLHVMDLPPFSGRFGYF